MIRTARSSLLLALPLLLLGCGSNDAAERRAATLEAQLAEVYDLVEQSRREQAERDAALAKKLDGLDARLGTLEKRGVGAARPARAPQEKAYDVEVGDSLVLGPKDAPVVIIVFTDFQCPFCARLHPLLEEAVEDPRLKGKVKVAYKNFPLSFHKQAMPAAKASLAVAEQGADKYWAFVRKLFENQASLSEERFSAWAQEVGADVARFERDLKRNDARYEDMIRADMRLGTTNARVRGTPTILVAGWELGQRSIDGIEALIRDKGL